MDIFVKNVHLFFFSMSISQVKKTAIKLCGQLSYLKNEFHFSDDYQSVNYIESLANE